MWSGNPSKYSHLQIFGSSTYAYVNTSELVGHSVKCIFIKYATGVKSYRLYNPESKKIIISKDVVFDEYFYSPVFNSQLLQASLMVHRKM